MHRRKFLTGAMSAMVLPTGVFADSLSGKQGRTENLLSSVAEQSPAFAETQSALKPMAVGLMIEPASGPEASIARVNELGLSNCFLSLDGYIGKFNKSLAQQLSALLEKYNVTATSVEVVGPGRLVWDFLDGPSTIGVVPRATRAARIDALKQTSDFAKMLGIPRVQTHCGFIPENPRDPLYPEAVLAIREVAVHCAANGQDFLMETGQETPTTMSRAIQDVNQPNLGVGLDTANLILYGKANPVDAVDIIGPHVKSVHAKDGKWPTDPMQLGEEVLIGTGRVDFMQVFTKLHKLGYTGAITIEREISGPQQIADVKKEKLYLERIIAQIQTKDT
ncbi:MAG TPA: sugar phosphate isomerase/epimerase family protein [Acidobacteriaceae bacterium]|jgi:sugar phosphate isomerase/epimerase|nr:sugar phosphate isomerase/epimerase family protein [Acidobacteriaceae bacterium]